MSLCPKCGKVVQVGMAFCGSCGARLGICPSCGKEVAKDQAYCPSCGAQLPPGAAGPYRADPGGQTAGPTSTQPPGVAVVSPKSRAATAILDLGVVLLVGVMVGIVLIVVGAGVGESGNKSVYLAGIAVSTLSLFAGGFLQKEENNVVRLGLFLAGAIILGSALGLTV